MADGIDLIITDRVQNIKRSGTTIGIFTSQIFATTREYTIYNLAAYIWKCSITLIFYRKGNVLLFDWLCIVTFYTVKIQKYHKDIDDGGWLQNVVVMLMLRLLRFLRLLLLLLLLLLFLL